MQVSLDPATLPTLDVMGLAQSGRLLRAERDTPPDGVPSFVTRQGWDELVRIHAARHEAPDLFVLSTLERAVARLLAHVAEATHGSSGPAPVVSLQSDLFASDPTLVLAFVRDETHSVGCAVIGTAEHIATLLRPEH